VAEAEVARPPAQAPVAARPRVASISTHQVRVLDVGWTMTSVGPDAIGNPAELSQHAMVWLSAQVPGTVASAHESLRILDLNAVPDFDASDWWYRCVFDADARDDTVARVLCLDGLATLAQVWLNGALVLRSDNMFERHEVDVGSLLEAQNELVIRFRSLGKALAARHPRPRWRARGIEHQQLRWHRTTLIGRMPGWSPLVKAVGPWGGIRLEDRAVLDVISGNAFAFAEPVGGTVDANLEIRPLGGVLLISATLHVGTESAALAVQPMDGGTVAIHGRALLPEAQHWWPHTHGDQPRYNARLVLATSGGEVDVEFGPVSFRRVDVDTSDGGFTVRVNDLPVFCRGACWTNANVTTLQGTPESYRHLLTLARDAGMNMLRIGGTMAYESDAFHDLCDELGIMVWQDFMFSNMDYPAADALFMESVRREATQLLARLRRHPSLAVLCGNSEVEQQAAMLGLDRALWKNALFSGLLPDLCASMLPEVFYSPSSPMGGALPFRVNSGVSHYYGVGAYLRPLDDARRAGVRFTSECLGFANVPSPSAVHTLLPSGEAPFHHPRWKARVPRDQGAGWDFDDIRDHYFAEQFGVDPMQTRYVDPERYLAMSRVVTGEVMTKTVTEWRRPGSSCMGALIWFYRDLWLGAGFGVVDAEGTPKASYYALKRAMQPLFVGITDEGLNGLDIHIANERPTSVSCSLAVSLLRGDKTVVASASADVTMEPRSASTIAIDSMFERFFDLAFAYRFGPTSHEVVVVTLSDAEGHMAAQAFHFTMGLTLPRSDLPIVTGVAVRVDSDTLLITLEAHQFAQSVAVECDGFLPEDNYFHMAAGTRRTIRARRYLKGVAFAGFVQALNAREGTRITFGNPN
jgi:beta-mannosidase